MDPCKFYLTVDKKFEPLNLNNLEKAERYCRIADDTPLVAPSDAAPPFVPTGFAKADKIIRELTTVFRYPQKLSKLYGDKSLRVFRGSIIHGKPGTGKSSIAKALRDECSRTNGKKLAYFDMDISAVLDGNPSSNLEKAFDATVKMKPSLLFIDEIELLLEEPRVRMDRLLLRIINALPLGIYVLAATNDLSSVPEALRRTGRLELIFELELPSPDERCDILSRMAVGLTDGVKPHLKKVAIEAKDFSPSDLWSLWTKAVLFATERLNKTLTNLDASTWGNDIKQEATVLLCDLKSGLESVKASKFARMSSSEGEDEDGDNS